METSQQNNQANREIKPIPSGKNQSNWVHDGKQTGVGTAQAKETLNKAKTQEQIKIEAGTHEWKTLYDSFSGKPFRKLLKKSLPIPKKRKNAK